jgi:hypothetical protein
MSSLFKTVSKGVLGAVWLAALPACLGELSNNELNYGEVEGSLVGGEAADAQIILAPPDGPQQRTDANGHFEFKHVAVGDYTLVALGRTQALTQQVHVGPGDLKHTPSLSMLEGGTLAVQVQVDGELAPGAQVSLAELPLTIQGGADGVATFTPVPQGCYTLKVSWRHREAIQPSCVPVGVGEHKHTVIKLEWDLDAGPVDAGPVDAGPVDAGPVDAGPSCEDAHCSQGQVCDPADGQCYACVLDTDCNSNGGGDQICQQHQCKPSVPYCAECNDNNDCTLVDQDHHLYYGVCLSLFPSEGKQCTYACNDTDDCAKFWYFYGYQCADLGDAYNHAKACVPDTSRISECDAVREVCATCGSDNDCRGAGLVDGVCRTSGPEAGTCTVPCQAQNNDWDCPDDKVCDLDGFCAVHR